MRYATMMFYFLLIMLGVMSTKMSGLYYYNFLPTVFLIIGFDFIDWDRFSEEFKIKRK